jgi:acetyl esterase
MTRFLSLLLAAFCGTAAAQDKQAKPGPDEKAVYKSVGGKNLEVWIWKPADWKAGDQRPAIVFYHGGGWQGGNPSAFSRQSARLAERGMVALSVEYRLTSQAGVQIADCVRDARSAFRWVRSNAAKLGIDPEKIAAGGGSAGGHLAATLVTLDGMDDPADDTSIPPRPAALVLFNPALKLDFPRATERASQAGVDLLALSPYHHLKKGHPPTVIFHGDADTTVPLSSVQAYAERVKQLGGKCEVALTPGAAHAFFNREPHVWDTLAQAETFLKKLGLVPGA